MSHWGLNWTQTVGPEGVDMAGGRNQAAGRNGIGELETKGTQVSTKKQKHQKTKDSHTRALEVI